jgi:hypothetical protein
MMQAQESSSFLKKRTKKLLLIGIHGSFQIGPRTLTVKREMLPWTFQEVHT